MGTVFFHGMFKKANLIHNREDESFVISKVIFLISTLMACYFFKGYRYIERIALQLNLNDLKCEKIK